MNKPDEQNGSIKNIEFPHMSRIETLLEYCSGFNDCINKDALIRTIQIYAEEYAKKVLKDAADKAELIVDWANKYDSDTTYYYIDKDSILNITLPPHE